jgi:hypothetical protein
MRVKFAWHASSPAHNNAGALLRDHAAVIWQAMVLIFSVCCCYLRLQYTAGAVYVVSSAGGLSILNSTFAGNSAGGQPAQRLAKVAHSYPQSSSPAVTFANTVCEVNGMKLAELESCSCACCGTAEHCLCTAEANQHVAMGHRLITTNWCRP